MTNTERQQRICTLSPDDLEQSRFFDGFMFADRKSNYFTNPKIKLGVFPNNKSLTNAMQDLFLSSGRRGGGGWGRWEWG